MILSRIRFPDVVVALKDREGVFSLLFNFKLHCGFTLLNEFYLSYVAALQATFSLHLSIHSYSVSTKNSPLDVASFPDMVFP